MMPGKLQQFEICLDFISLPFDVKYRLAMNFVRLEIEDSMLPQEELDELVWLEVTQNPEKFDRFINLLEAYSAGAV